ncbi:MAG: hypothetical protein ACXU86_15215, partial [Archangium sp.]
AVMRKGVSGAQNVALLRWCQESGVDALWNLIYGFPREDPDDYARTLSLLQKLVHLRPPDICSPIRMDRFSPNHAGWREQGFTRIRPMPAYRHVFPFPEQALHELAYYFDYEHPRFDEVLARGAAFQSFILQWQERHRRGDNGELAVRPHWQGGFVLVDSRFNLTPASERLAEATVSLLLACDAPTSREQALRTAAGATDTSGPEALERELARLLERGVIASMGSRLVTLATLPDGLRTERLARAA